MLQDDEIVGSLLEQIHSITHPKQLSLITIRGSLESPKNDDVSVFPPVNHENLQIPSHPTRDQRKQQDPSTKSSSSLSLPPSDFSADSSKEVKLVIGWLDFGLEILRAKIMSAYSWFCNDGESRRVFDSFGPVAGVAVLVLWWWLCRRIKRGRRARESVEHLKLIIKEKDEKISKLLHQIAQMNEVLVARHKVLASKLAN